MAYVRQISLPTSEPVALDWMKNYLRVDSGYTGDDSLISALITGAREYGETITGRTLAQRKFRMTLDSFPYYTDTIQSQLAYPPSYYSLPRYSTTLWNYSQMIKVWKAPLVSIDQMRYVDTAGNDQTLTQDTDFVLDLETEPARIFPMPGQFWPACLYVPNAVIIDFTAGFDPNPAAAPVTDTVSNNPPDEQTDQKIDLAVPQSIVQAIAMLVAFWYENRSGGSTVPSVVDNLFLQNGVFDFQPTRG